VSKNLRNLDLKDIHWLDDCLAGKYRGLDKAARVYNAALRQPLYFRMVILELMENLTSGNEEVRRNSLWMLSKIVDERTDYNFMSPTIQILSYAITEKNNAICYYASRIINEIAGTYFNEFKSALPRIAENLNRSSSKIKLVTASIISQFMETEPNAMATALRVLVQALKEKEPEIREVAIKALLRIDQHVDQVVQAIMESFGDENFRSRMIKHIFAFIKRNPGKVIKGLCVAIKSKDEKIRTNAIIFMHQVALTKHSFEVVKAVPELLDAISDKNKIIRRTAMLILYNIAKINPKSLYRGIEKFLKFLKTKNKILLTYDIYILVRLIKYFPDDLDEQIDPLIKRLEKSLLLEETTPEIEIINTLSICHLLRYKNELTRVLNLAQECAKNYSLEKSIYELHLFIGYTHYYLENYSDAIQAFLKCESAGKKGDYVTTAVANIMIAFIFALVRSFKSCLDYKNDAVEYFELAKDHISDQEVHRLQLLLKFIEAIASQEFQKAETSLKAYQALDPVKHPYDRKLQLIDLFNIKKVEKYYKESQEIMTELKRDDTESEPQILDK